MTAIKLYLAVCVAAALLAVEHLALVWRAVRRRDNPVLAWLLPPVAGWRAGERGAVVRYGLWVVVYAILALYARAAAMR